jgi:lysine 2,3-aminomutase
VPTYVVDAPGGGGKIPVQPNYIVSQAPGKVVLRNFEGFITTYQEPLDYDPEAIKAQEALIAPRPEPGQEGIHGLLQGQKMSIEPEGFAQTRPAAARNTVCAAARLPKSGPRWVWAASTPTTSPSSRS